MTPTGRLRADGARLGYGNRIISSCLDLAILDAEFTAVVGSRAVGKRLCHHPYQHYAPKR